MAASPVPVLIIIGVYAAFFLVITGTQATYGVDEEREDLPEEGQFGGVDIIGDIIDAVFGVLKSLVGALTFNVEGAPLYIRIPVATAIIGSLTWSIVTLIRGT